MTTGPAYPVETLPPDVSPPRWATSSNRRCRYCGAIITLSLTGDMVAIYAGTMRARCTARPFWRAGKGHE